MKLVLCCHKGCGMEIHMTDNQHSWFRADARRSFHCLHGHSQHFSNEDNDIEKLRRERDRLKQNQAWYEENRVSLEGELAKARKEAKRTKLRVGAGVCPCCSRQFKELHRHMRVKHPQYRAEALQ